MVSIEKILRFGRDLHLMGEQLKKEKGRNEENEKALKVARARPLWFPVFFTIEYCCALTVMSLIS